MKKLFLGMLSVTCSLASVPRVYADDVVFGGNARAYAMGGAGIALIGGAGGANRNNPATLAFEKSASNIYFPGIGLRGDGGLSLSNIGSFLAASGNKKDLTSYAKNFYKEDSNLSLDASIGFRVANFEVYTSGYVVGRIIPNATLQSYSGTGPVPSGSAAEGIASGIYTLPSFGYAVPLPVRVGARYETAVGVRVKKMNALYSHFIADKNLLDNGGNALRAPEMNGKDSLSKTGTGIDVGLSFRDKRRNGLTGALVIGNLIKPDLHIRGASGVSGNLGNLPVTTASAGVAYEKGALTLVGDLTDFFGGAGKQQARAGAEVRVGKLFKARAGYATATGFTTGFGAFGFDLAFGKHVPLEVYRTIRF